MNEKIKNIIELDKTSKNILKVIKLYLLSIALIVSKNEIKNYIDSENLKPDFNVSIQTDVEILPENGANLKVEDYASIKRYECEKVVEKYSNIYGIKKDIVINIIKEYTE